MMMIMIDGGGDALGDGNGNGDGDDAYTVYHLQPPYVVENLPHCIDCSVICAIPGTWTIRVAFDNSR